MLFASVYCMLTMSTIGCRLQQIFGLLVYSGPLRVIVPGVDIMLPSLTLTVTASDPLRLHTGYSVHRWRRHLRKERHETFRHGRMREDSITVDVSLLCSCIFPM